MSVPDPVSIQSAGERRSKMRKVNLYEKGLF